MDPTLNLTPRQYRVCLLRYGRGRNQMQIARRLGISRQRVGQLLAAAKRKYPALALQDRRKGGTRPRFDPLPLTA